MRALHRIREGMHLPKCMSITNTTKKVIAGSVAVIAGIFMLGGAAIAPVYAQSNAQLQTQIQMLLQTVATLQAQINSQTGSGISNCSSMMLNSNLSLGNRGQAVRALQQFLNKDSATRVAAAGPGSLGQETDYFGPLTNQAVRAFQAKYSASVLSPVGLTNPTGFWGPSSRAHAQRLCTQTPTTPTTPTNPGGGSNQTGTLRGGEASLEKYDMSRGDDAEIEEGRTGEIADFEFDVEDGDVRISRVDINFVKTGADGDNDPWDVFEEIVLLHDGDEVASKDVSDDNDWLNDGSSYSGSLSGTEQFIVRFSNVDTIVRENDTAEFTIAVTAQNNVDDADQDVSWGVFIDDSGIRVSDSEGLQSYTGDDTDTVEFSVDVEGEGEELNVSTSADDPNQSIIQVNENSRSDDYGIFAFDMEAEGNDLDLNELIITLQFDNNGSDDYGDIVDDAYIEIDGDRFDVDDETYTNGSDTATLAFDVDGDFTIDEDDEVTTMLYLVFKAQNGNYDQGVTVQASVDADDFDVEGADDLSVSQLDGAETGEEHTLLVSGLFANGAASISTDSNNNRIQYTFNVDLTAFEEAAFIKAGEVTSDILDITISSPGAGAVSLLDIAANNITENSNGNYRITKGQTKKFTITVEFEADDKTSHRATLNSIDYAATNVSATNEANYTKAYNFTPASDFRSGLKAETTN